MSKQYFATLVRGKGYSIIQPTAPGGTVVFDRDVKVPVSKELAEILKKETQEFSLAGEKTLFEKFKITSENVKSLDEQLEEEAAEDEANEEGSEEESASVVPASILAKVAAKAAAPKPKPAAPKPVAPKPV